MLNNKENFKRLSDATLNQVLGQITVSEVEIPCLGAVNLIKAIQDQMNNGGIPHPDDIKGLVTSQEEMAVVIAALEPADPIPATTATTTGEHS